MGCVLMYLTASSILRILSLSVSGISIANSSSIAITTSTVSRESSPRSAENCEAEVTFEASTLSKLDTTVITRLLTTPASRNASPAKDRTAKKLGLTERTNFGVAEIIWRNIKSVCRMQNWKSGLVNGLSCVATVKYDISTWMLFNKAFINKLQIKIRAKSKIARYEHSGRLAQNSWTSSFVHHEAPPDSIFCNLQTRSSSPKSKPEANPSPYIIFHCR